MKSYYVLAGVLFVLPAYGMNYLKILAGYTKNHYNQQLLMAAAGQLDISVLKNILSQGNGNINCQDEEGQTPLHIAVFNNNAEAVKELLSYSSTHINAQDFLKKTPLLLAVYQCHTDLIKQLLSAGVNINLSDMNGTAPLHQAVFADNKEVIADLLSSSEINVNAQNRFGNTALCYAVLNNKKALIHSLLEAGADPNIQNKDGLTSLHIAVTVNKPEYNRLVQLLLDNQAQFNIKDKNGVTAIDIARDSENSLKYKIKGNCLLERPRRNTRALIWMFLMSTFEEDCCKNKQVIQQIFIDHINLKNKSKRAALTKILCAIPQLNKDVIQAIVQYAVPFEESILKDDTSILSKESEQ